MNSAASCFSDKIQTEKLKNTKDKIQQKKHMAVSLEFFNFSGNNFVRRLDGSRIFEEFQSRLFKKFLKQTDSAKINQMIYQMIYQMGNLDSRVPDKRTGRLLFTG